MSFSLTELLAMVREHIASPHGGGSGEHIVDETEPVDPPDGLLWTHPSAEGVVTGTVPIGSMMMWATATAPSGWLICDGSSFSAATYPNLATVLGGTTLPDMRTRFPVGVGSGHALGATGGSQTVTLTEAQMPSHTHSLPDHVHPDNHNHDLGTIGAATHLIGRGKTGTGSSQVSVSGTRQVNSLSQTVTRTGNTGNPTTNPQSGSKGSDGSHENRPPFLAVHFIIKAAL